MDAGCGSCQIKPQGNNEPLRYLMPVMRRKSTRWMNRKKQHSKITVIRLKSSFVYTEFIIMINAIHITFENWLSHGWKWYRSTVKGKNGLWVANILDARAECTVHLLGPIRISCCWFLFAEQNKNSLDISQEQCASVSHKICGANEYSSMICTSPDIFYLESMCELLIRHTW